MILRRFAVLIVLLGNLMVNSEEAVAASKKELAEGLIIEELKAGSGKQATKGSKVEVHYTGWLAENGWNKGKKFDSSLDRGSPFAFPLGAGQVIRGWDQGVTGMKEGEKRVLYIPAALGYGTQGAGAVIPPNSNLIFEVELLKVQ